MSPGRLASIVAVGSYPIWVAVGAWRGWLKLETGPVLLAATVTALLVLARHRSNFRRIRIGEESQIDLRAGRVAE